MLMCVLEADGNRDMESPPLALRRCNKYALTRQKDHYLLLGRQRSFLRAFGVASKQSFKLTWTRAQSVRRKM